MKGVKTMKIDLYTYLTLIAYGKDNAILVNDLCSSLGVSRRIIRKLRSENNKKNKVKIITCSKGYFIPNPEDKEEIKKDAYYKIKAGLSQIKEAKELFRFYNLDNSLEIDFEKLEIKENKIGG